MPLLASNEDKNDQSTDKFEYEGSQETEGKPEIVKMVEARKKVLANYTMLLDTA